MLPSYSEGFSISGAGGLAAGVPVVVTTSCHIPEVSLNRCGWVIKPAIGPLEQAFREFLSLSPKELYEWEATGGNWLTGGSIPPWSETRWPKCMAGCRAAPSRRRSRSSEGNQYDGGRGSIQFRIARDSDYRVGRSFFVRTAWFLVGMPLLRCPIMPSSFFRSHLLRWFGAEVGAGAVIKPGVRVKFPGN